MIEGNYILESLKKANESPKKIYIRMQFDG